LTNFYYSELFYVSFYHFVFGDLHITAGLQDFAQGQVHHVYFLLLDKIFDFCSSAPSLSISYKYLHDCADMIT
jgi:hypothetical protein